MIDVQDRQSRASRKVASPHTTTFVHASFLTQSVPSSFFSTPLRNRPSKCLRSSSASVLELDPGLDAKHRARTPGEGQVPSYPLHIHVSNKTLHSQSHFSCCFCLLRRRLMFFLIRFVFATMDDLFRMQVPEQRPAGSMQKLQGPCIIDKPVKTRKTFKAFFRKWVS